MRYLLQLVKDNGHKLIPYNQAREAHEYIDVFSYSSQYGGTFDGFKYYNNYYIEIK